MAPSRFPSLRLVAAGLFSCMSILASALSTADTILIIARDDGEAQNNYGVLQGYGIPYKTLIVPSGGAALPALSSSADYGNYAGILVCGEVTYQYGSDWKSALTDAQWTQLYNYQTAFGVRMVRTDVYPSSDFGVSAVGCTDADAAISLTNTTGFATANLKTGAGLSTAGLYHCPGKITSKLTTWEVAKFAAGGGLASSSAAVINKFGARQQMVWFLPFATDWSQTSAYLSHVWIHWLTRGLYNGFRRIYFNTQIDDMFLSTDIYKTTNTFRIRTGDLDAHKTWMNTINAKLPTGSKYMIEIAHNGNGDIIAATAADKTGKTCIPEDAVYTDDQAATELEFKKPLGTGKDLWPPTPTKYVWSLACAQLDALEKWWVANMNSFMHLSHTFTHLSLNNATFADVNKEITFNQQWFAQLGLDKATYFSSNGLVPPAITGLHNGDAIRAWLTNGIKNVVGDNTRPVLRNPTSTYWPLISNSNDNGYDGLVIMPRWSTTIFYNCDKPACTTQEWIDTSGGAGSFTDLLTQAKLDNTRYLFGLHWDPYMFHQANLRQTDQSANSIGGVSAKRSLLMSWTETVLNEMVRLCTWPIITLKHDDIANEFVKRMTRDQCKPNLKYTYSANGKSITGATLSTTNNQCGTPIPVTFPGPIVSTNGGRTEQIGSDPLTVWATMSGSPITFTLTTPVAL